MRASSILVQRIGRIAGAPVVIAAAMLSACAPAGEPHASFMAGDYAAAFKSFAQRADTGDPTASNFMGIHYYLGLGVERDLAQAANWFERAATAANSDAQRNLGMLYLRGLGVPRDNLRAYAWLYAAAQAGNQRARAYLESAEYLITPNQMIQARAWVTERLRQGRTR